MKFKFLLLIVAAFIMWMPASARAIAVAADEFILEFDGSALQAAQVGSSLGAAGTSHRIRLLRNKNKKRELREVSEAILTAKCAALLAASKASNCTPNYQVTASKTPNDSNYPALYGMKKISAPTAWGISTGSAATTVAVIDTGVDYTHPDLADNIWTNSGEIPDNNIDDDANGYVDDVHGYDFVNEDSDPMDDNSHGTHVSGTIAAKGDNALGVAGVTWNVKIMALKFLDSAGSGYLSDAIRAVDYAVENGARITNNSWGGGGYSLSLYNAISRANDAGVLFIAAAGNEANDNDASESYPAGYDLPNVISVAAVDRSDNLAYFSNYGSHSVDLAAPGVRIVSTVPDGKYASYSGTSMATPHVSGALALMLSVNPELSAEDLRSILLGTVDTVGSLTGLVETSGRLNVARAVVESLQRMQNLDVAVVGKLSASKSTSAVLYGGKVASMTISREQSSETAVHLVLELYGTTCSSTATLSLSEREESFGGKMPVFPTKGSAVLTIEQDGSRVGGLALRIASTRGSRAAVKGGLALQQVQRLCSVTLKALTSR